MRLRVAMKVLKAPDNYRGTTWMRALPFFRPGLARRMEALSRAYQRTSQPKRGRP